MVGSKRRLASTTTAHVQPSKPCAAAGSLCSSAPLPCASLELGGHQRHSIATLSVTVLRHVTLIACSQQPTLALKWASTSRLGDFKSRCSTGTGRECRYSMPRAASSACTWQARARQCWLASSHLYVGPAPGQRNRQSHQRQYPSPPWTGGAARAGRRQQQGPAEPGPAGRPGCRAHRTLWKG